MRAKSVLVSGAKIAGPTLAFRLNAPFRDYESLTPILLSLARRRRKHSSSCRFAYLSLKASDPILASGESR